jgi:putative ABC transport system permease protein
VTGGGIAPLLRLAWRESRTTRRHLLLSMSAISLGAAALVAVDSFAANIRSSVHDQSRTILGGDVALDARGPFPAVATLTIDSLQRAGAQLATLTSFPSMAIARVTGPDAGHTRLVQVRAVSPSYPLAGQVATDPASAWPALQSGPNAVVDPALLITLGLHVGDSISLGLATFDIVGTLKSVPGDAGIAAAIGPRVFIPDRYLTATTLLTAGSRAEYRALLTSNQPSALAAALRPRLESVHVRLQTAAESDANLSRSVERLDNFLGLVGLVALLLGGIGVASGINAFVARKIDTVAILRCLGATGPQVLALYLIQAAAMGLAGAALGAALGVALQFGLPSLVHDFLPVDVEPRIVPRAVLVGLATGLWVAVLFALRPLLGVRAISPLQALRRTTTELRPPTSRATWWVDLAAILGVLVFALARSPSRRDGFGIALGVAAVLLALWASAAALSALARRITRPQWPYVLRQGIANLYRPANQTRAVVLALGFGAFLISTLYLVQTNILAELNATADSSRGNLLFFDVQDDQRPGLDSALGSSVVERAPLVTMRIAEIDGTPVSALHHADTTKPHRAGWALRREYRSTYRDTLVSSEKIVAGHWFRTPSDTAELSLETDVAKELGVTIGDHITWDVQGVRIPTRITSLRTVDWARFEPNFFAVFPSGVLEHAPQQWVILANAPSPTAIADLQRAIIDRYPNVSSIDLTLVRATIEGVLRKVTLAVRFMALFCVAIGLPVLVGAVAATRRDRIRDGVLLKTLGASRAQIGRMMTAEYAALGLLGSLTGMILSFGGAWAVLHFVFDIPFHPAIGPAVGIAALTAVLTITIGLLGSRDVFAATPMAALRAE